MICTNPVPTSRLGLDFLKLLKLVRGGTQLHLGCLRVINVVLLCPFLSQSQALKVVLDLFPLLKVVHVVVLESPHHNFVHVVRGH